MLQRSPHKGPSPTSAEDDSGTADHMERATAVAMGAGAVPARHPEERS